jgi:hypothetical protein
VDQLVSMDRLLKEQHSLGDIVKTEHSALLDSIFVALNERVTGNGISSNQVRTLLDEFSSTIMQMLVKWGGAWSVREGARTSGGGNEVGVSYDKRQGYLIYCGLRKICTCTYVMVFP